MPINVDVSEQDYGKLAALQKEGDYGFKMSTKEVQGYLRHINPLLRASGITDATVSLLHESDLILHGATRIPLLIKTGEEKFIVKRFDQYSPAREKEMLIKLQDSIAPKTLVFGKRLYIEEYLDPSVYIPLPEIFNRNSDEALGLVGNTLATLAARNVGLSHWHYFDEFRQNKDSGVVKATDLGSCKPFLAEGESASVDNYIQIAKTKPVEKVVGDLLNIIPNMENLRVQDPEKYREFATAIVDISKITDATTLVNIMLVLSTAASGLKNFYERDTRKYPDPWRSALVSLDKIYKPFFKTYRELTEAKKT